MKAKEFSLMECYTLACYGLRAEINAGKLMGFSMEEGLEWDASTKICGGKRAGCAGNLLKAAATTAFTAVKSAVTRKGSRRQERTTKWKQKGKQRGRRKG